MDPTATFDLPASAALADDHPEGAGVARQRSAFSQFAVNVVDRQVGRLSGALSGAADSIQSVVDQPDSPIDQTFRGYAESATEQLRKLADRAGNQDGAEMIDGLRKLASANPATTAAIGAAVGAALGLAIATLGSRLGDSVAD
jgi:ElaB/YqjD/DUF883 family membrane-anchored ribosome-binding protein